MRRLVYLALLSIIPLAARAQTKPPFSISAETTAITAPLTPDGFPDYIAALNQKYSKDVTPDNNAFAALLQIRGTENNTIAPSVHDQFLKMLDIKPTPANTNTWQSYDEYLTTLLPADQRRAATNEFASLRNRPWKAQESANAATYLKNEDNFLNAIVEASNRTRYWFPYVSPNGSMMEYKLPTIGPLRDMAYALATRATLRAGSADFDGFLSDVAAIEDIVALLRASSASKRARRAGRLRLSPGPHAGLVLRGRRRGAHQGHRPTERQPAHSAERCRHRLQCQAPGQHRRLGGQRAQPT